MRNKRELNLLLVPYCYSRKKIKQRTLKAIIKGVCIFRIDDSILTGLITEDTPRINAILEILLPIIFPIVISPEPSNAAIRQTINSGDEVPNATMVSPTTTGFIPIPLANPEEPLTSISPPAINPAIPRMNKAILTNKAELII